jgi:hypothetical protein
MTVYEGVAWLGNRVASAAQRRAQRQKAIQGARRSIGPTIQICGLAVLDYAAFEWTSIAGFIAVGISLLIVGEQLKGGDE